MKAFLCNWTSINRLFRCI